MQKQRKIFFGFAVLLIAVIFTMAGCGNPAGGNKKSNDDGKGEVFYVSGTFDNKAFELYDETTTARAVTAESYAVSGTLEDGDMLFRLKGTYNPDKRTYTVSSASSGFTYTINGGFDASGAPIQATATVAVKGNGGEETIITYIVDVSKNAANIDTTGTYETEAEGGLPEKALGYWSIKEEDFEVSFIATQWGLNLSYPSSEEGEPPVDMKATVISVETIDTNNDDVLFSYPFYRGSDEQIDAAIQQFATEQKLGTITKYDDSMIDGPYIYLEGPDGDKTFVSASNDLLSLINGTTDEQSTVMAILKSYPNITDTDKETLNSLLSSAGLTFDDIQFLEESPYPPTDSISYFVDDYGYVGFSAPVDLGDAVWNKIDLWWSTNYQERYMINKGVEPIIMYEKYRINYMSESMITLTPFGIEDDGGPYYDDEGNLMTVYITSFDDLAELDTAELVEDEDYVMPVTRQ